MSWSTIAHIIDVDVVLFLPLYYPTFQAPKPHSFLLFFSAWRNFFVVLHTCMP